MPIPLIAHKLTFAQVRANMDATNFRCDELPILPGSTVFLVRNARRDMLERDLNARETDALASEEARNPTVVQDIQRGRRFKPVKAPTPRRSDEETHLLAAWLEKNKPVQVASCEERRSSKTWVGAIL